MKKAILYGILVAAVCFSLKFMIESSQYDGEFPDSDVKLFNLWAVDYGKKYSSPAERDYRMKVFMTNLENMREKQKVVSHKVGINEFTDYTYEEAKVKFFGL